jgi:hypothetical protein
MGFGFYKMLTRCNPYSPRRRQIFDSLEQDRSAPLSLREDPVGRLDQIIMRDFVPQFSQLAPLLDRGDNSALLGAGQAIEHRAFIGQLDLVQRAEQPLHQEIAKPREARRQSLTGFSLPDGQSFPSFCGLQDGVYTRSGFLQYPAGGPGKFELLGK